MVLGMGPHEIIDLSSDEESELASVDVVDVKPNLLSSVNQLKASCRNAIVRPKLEACSTLDARQNGVQNGSSVSPSVPLCRQFWKSGEYEVGQVSGPSSRNGGNRLRIHPKFLHSNATSHKWAFGALAELLDNAVDEVQNGATFVVIDKFNNLQTRDAALLIQDDGGGMGPESLRRCMSFGFSDKQSGSSIGQYGNGFKTSTMRLGADVIVFSRCIKKRALTQSVGLLSYTFLRQTGSDDIVVPVVDFEFDQATGAFERQMPYGQKQFSSNLSTLLKWSPFDTEEELLKQFNDIGHHGTKIVIYNLWFNDEGKLELDFESDAEDIYICGSHKRAQTTNEIKLLNENHVANRLHYSLRAYLSILYLQIPEKFKIILRGTVVEHHNIVKDINYLECVKYRPQVGGTTEAEVITFIGFLRGAPNLNVHGFNVYHRNRLILPFWKVANNSYGKGRGVAGVLEANFIKPTHDKQDFEKSTLYQKLETRLKEMTYEYWDYHCHLFGYAHSKVGPPVVPIKRMRRPRACDSEQQGKIKFEVEQDISPPSHQLANKLVVAGSPGPTYSAPTQLTQNIANSRRGLPEKRRHGDHVDGKQALKTQAVGNNNKIQVGHGVGQEKIQEIRSMVQENKKLRSQCLGYEERKKDLLLKERELRSELQEVQQLYRTLLLELKSMDEVKMEKL